MSGSSDLLLKALSWVDLAIFAEVQRVRSRGRSLGKDSPWGAYIGEGEVDEILGELLSIGPFRLDPETGGRLRDLLSQRGEEVQATLAEARTKSEGDPLVRLEASFGLSTHELQLLLLALAPEVNARYLRLFAYLQDDLSAQHLTPALALRLLTDDRGERLRLGACLGPDSPLIRSGLLLLGGVDSPSPRPLPARPVSVAPRIARWLLQGEEWDSDLLPWCCLEGAELVNQPVRPPVAAAVDGVLSVLTASGTSPLIHLQARSRRDAIESARCLASRLSCPLVVADLTSAARLGITPESVAGPLAREACLQGASLLVLDPPEGQDVGDPLAPLLVATQELGRPLLVYGGSASATRPLSAGRRYLGLDLPGQTLSEREAAWDEALTGLRKAAGRSKKARARLADLDSNVLARRFRFSPGQIAQVLEVATDRAAAAGDARPSSEDVLSACADTFLPDPGPLAERCEVKRGWDDLVLPDDARLLLEEMVSQIERREEVLEALGSTRVRAGERGIKALFSGPPGTGKTLSAEVLARSLGYPLFRVDLSSVVSKYVGETEKHLNKLFVATEQAPCVLLFDEADALFGKRAEVKGAQDRFANLEVSYLLQRLEAFEGVAVLTTNLKRNIDEAFLRRFTFVVDFPFPERAQREAIWQRVLPEAFPLSEGLDIADLAAEFKLAGANIWNVAVAASVAAAQTEARRITRDMLAHAVRREYEKLGREVAALRPTLLTGGTRLDEDAETAAGLVRRDRPGSALSAAEARRISQANKAAGPEEPVGRTKPRRGN